MNRQCDQLLKTKTVLLVEDDRDTAFIFRKMLSHLVKEVQAVDNGEEALERLESYNADIIITDIEMPVMNGLELLREIKKRSPEKVVAIITAFEDEAEKAGEADAVLIKPVLKPVLKERLCRALGL